MTIDDYTKDEKLQHNINREAAKISVLSSGQIDKYEYLIYEGILLSNQKQIIEKARFNYFQRTLFSKNTQKQLKIK